MCAAVELLVGEVKHSTVGFQDEKVVVAGRQAHESLDEVNLPIYTWSSFNSTFVLGETLAHQHREWRLSTGRISSAACRLRAMEVMAHGGWEPTLELWDEPGVAFSLCAVCKSKSESPTAGNCRKWALHVPCKMYSLRLLSNCCHHGIYALPEYGWNGWSGDVHTEHARRGRHVQAR